MKTVRRTLAALLCLAFSLAPFPTLADELSALMWLEKMGAALREQSYEGTYIYMRGSQFDTMSVVHHFENGEEYERLVSLTGKPREVVRHNADTVLINPEEHENLPYPGLRGPFTHRFNENLSENLEMYRYNVHGIGRIAGRPAVKVSISPRNSDRYGYRLWLDQETGLLLRSNLVNKGRVLELFQFTEVTIGDELETARALVTSVPEAMTGREVLGSGAQVAQAGTPQRPEWRVSWVPRGFRPVGGSGNEMVFSDGVATLSIFVENKTGKSLGNVQTTVGGTVVLTRESKDAARQVTVVGEVPVDTAEKIAESVEPVIY